MKRLALILIVVLILPFAFAIQQQTKEIDEGINLQEAAIILNESKPEIPPPIDNFIKNEKVNIYVDNDVLSIVVEEGVVVEASNIEVPDPTIEATTSWETINNIRNNELKVSEALKTKAIDIRGVGFWNGLKVGFFKIGLRLAAPKFDDYLEQEANETQETEKKQEQKKETEQEEKKEEAKEKAKGKEELDCYSAYQLYQDCSKGTCSEGYECVMKNPEHPLYPNCTCKKKETPVEYTCSKKTPPNCHLGTCPGNQTCAEYNKSSENETICSCGPYERWAQASCTDSDGKDPDEEGYVKGWTKDSNGVKTEFKIWDECTGSGLQVNEKYCYDNSEGTGEVHGTLVYDCENGCEDGACKSDSENKVQTQQKCSDGTLYGNCSTTKPKYCYNGDLVDRCSECGCESGYACQSDGTCKVATAQDNTCVDSDGKNPDSKGYVEGNYNGQSYKIYDTCTGSGLQVNEKWCYTNIDGTVHGTMVFNCANGCEGGACK